MSHLMPYAAPLIRPSLLQLHVANSATGARLQPSYLSFLLTPDHFMLARLLPLQLELRVRSQQRLRPRTGCKT